MRVFLVGEGPTDIGGLAAEPPYKSDGPGFIQPIVRKVVGQGVSFDGQKVSLLGKVRVRTLRQALARKAFVAAMLAEDAGSDLLVFAVDLDRGSGSGRRAAESDLEARRRAIHAGCREAAEDKLACAAAVACRTIEAWALADRDAVATAFGIARPIELPGGKEPEELWGRPRDPAGNHPKFVLARIIGRKASRDDLSEIAERADIAQLKRACPLSFEPFLAELEAAA